MSPLQLFKTQHTGQTEMFWSVLAFLGSYGFRENADRMVESIHKNGIYSKARNAMELVNYFLCEFDKFWMNLERQSLPSAFQNLLHRNVEV